MYKDTIIFYPGLSMIFLDSFESTLHNHYPLEIYLGLDGDFEIQIDNIWHSGKSILINSNIPHKFRGNNGQYLLVLMDPDLKLFKEGLGGIFKNENFIFPDEIRINPFIEKFKKLLFSIITFEKVENLLNEFLSSLFDISFQYYTGKDERIIKIFNKIKSNDFENLTAGSLSEYVNLSESRLSHLFSEIVGIPMSRYLLWAKLITACRLLMKGFNVTEAAHESGFSDSAHLSRTYREFFGLKPTHLFSKIKEINVITE